MKNALQMDRTLTLMIGGVLWAGSTAVLVFALFALVLLGGSADVFRATPISLSWAVGIWAASFVPALLLTAVSAPTESLFAVREGDSGDRMQLAFLSAAMSASLVLASLPGRVPLAALEWLASTVLLGVILARMLPRPDRQ